MDVSKRRSGVTVELRAGSEGFDHWREYYLATSMPLEIVPNERCRDCHGECNEIGSPFTGGLTVGALGSMQLQEVTAGAADIHRTRPTIRISDPGLIKVGLQIRGNGLLIQHEREAVLTPGDFVIYDTNQPYGLRFENHFTMFFLMIPRDRLRLPSGLKTAVAVPIRTYGHPNKRAYAEGFVARDRHGGLLIAFGEHLVYCCRRRRSS